MYKNAKSRRIINNKWVLSIIPIETTTYMIFPMYGRLPYTPPINTLGGFLWFNNIKLIQYLNEYYSCVYIYIIYA